MKTNRIIFWISTGLLSLLMLFSAFNYFVAYDAVSKIFVDLGYSTDWVYPLAILKVLGVVAILTRKVKALTLLAYLGFLVDFVLALEAHLRVGDGEFGGAVVALILLTTSFIFYKRTFGK